MAKKIPSQPPAKPTVDSVSKTNIEEAEPTIRAIKQQQTRKLSLTAPGFLTYSIGIDDSTQNLYIKLQANASGGYFSQEWVPLSHVDACLASVKPNEMISASLFKSAFISRSQNNAGFLAAVLKAEGLLVSVADKVNGLRVDTSHRDKWQQTLLALAKNPGEVEPNDDDALLEQVMHSS